MFPRRLHPDREVAALLHRWSMVYSSLVGQACRELFSDMGELQAFFDAAFPKAGRLTQSDGRGYVHTDDGFVDIDALSALRLLKTLEVERDQLQPAAYLVAQQHLNAQRDGSTQLIQTHFDLTSAKKILQTFKSVPAQTLIRRLRYMDWHMVDASRWAIECDRLGVPDGYIQDLVVRPLLHGKAENPWTAEQVAGLYSDGLPLEYLIQFWRRPRVLMEMWEHRLPLEYAIALDESTRTD